jgi:hypothetical protein
MTLIGSPATRVDPSAAALRHGPDGNPRPRALRSAVAIGRPWSDLGGAVSPIAYLYGAPASRPPPR